MPGGIPLVPFAFPSADGSAGQPLVAVGAGRALQWGQDLSTAASPTFATVKLSGLTDGYIPYHVADATGLANSGLFYGGANFGVNTASPGKRFDILDASAAQLRLTHTAASVYTDFQTDSNGYLNVTPSGTKTIFAGFVRFGGTGAPSYPVSITSSLAKTIEISGNNATDLVTSGYYYGIDDRTVWTDAVDGSNAPTIYGHISNQTFTGALNTSGTVLIYGMVGTPGIGSAITAVGASSTLVGAYVFPYTSGSGTFPAAYGLRAGYRAGGTSTITTGMGIRIENPAVAGSGTITNNYGLYIESQTRGTSANYAIYVGGGYSYFGGNVSMGDTPSSTARLYVHRTSTNETGYSIYAINSGISSSAGTYTYRGGYFRPFLTVSENTTNYMTAVYGAAIEINVSTGKTSSGYVMGVWGDAYVSQASCAGTLASLIGVNARAGINSCAAGTTVTSAKALQAQILNSDADGTITAGYGLYVDAAGGTGTLTTNYAIYLSTQTGGATNWQIYSVGGNSAFGGNTRFGGVTAPTAKVHCAAGTTSASTAPLKFTSGDLMTAAEAGAVEFLTDKAYLTITTGTARKEFTLNDAALTSGTTPVATTNGRLTDGIILAGTTYTPTLTIVSNLDSATVTTCYYSRTGNTVTVAGKITVNPTSLGACQLRISLPIASNFTNDGHCSGMGYNGSKDIAYILGDTTNDEAFLSITVTASADPQYVYFWLFYTIA